jgi:hypothetical protein
MSQSSAKNRKPASKVVTRRTAFLIAVAAFGAGAGTVWLILREPGAPASQQPPTYVVKGPGAADAGAGATPPDVSKLPPAASEVALGNWEYDREGWPKAIEHYERAISLGTDNADVRTDLGNAYRLSGDARKALAEYEIARREDPQHENSLFNMASLYAEVLHDPANAVRAWEEYLRRFPNGQKASVARQYLAETDLQTLNGGQAPQATGSALPK